MKRVQLNVWCVYSSPHIQGRSLIADLQKVTGEEDDMSGAHQSKQLRALYRRDFLRRGNSCCRKQTVFAVVVSGLAQYSQERSLRDPEDMAENKT